MTLEKVLGLKLRVAVSRQVKLVTNPIRQCSIFLLSSGKNKVCSDSAYITILLIGGDLFTMSQKAKVGPSFFVNRWKF